jgi:hypothetical protein
MNVRDFDDEIDRDIVDALKRDARTSAPRAARERVFQRVTLGAAVLGAATTAGTGGAVAAVATASHSTFGVISALVVGAGIGFGTHMALDAIEAPAAPPPVARPAPQLDKAPRVPTTPPIPARGAAPEPTVTVNPMPDLPKPEPLRAPTPAITEPIVANPSTEVPPIDPPGLAAQQALLDEARSALVRRDGASALSAVGAHRLRFPETALLEERSALEIRALAELGRMDEARRQFESFTSPSGSRGDHEKITRSHAPTRRLLRRATRRRRQRRRQQHRNRRQRRHRRHRRHRLHRRSGRDGSGSGPGAHRLDDRRHVPDDR